MKNYKTNIQMVEILEDDKEYSHQHISGTGESFVEYSFDINNNN